MSRRYPVADVYEERERDFYARPRADRNYEELDIDITRNRYPDRPASVISDRRSVRPGKTPDFLRDDYGRTAAGPLVVREREREEFDTFSRRGPPERVEKDELIIRERERRPERAPPREVVEREEIIMRRGDREPERPRPRERERVDETDIVIRRGDRESESERPRRREREVEETDIMIRRGGERESERERPRRREREVEETDITIRRGEPEPQEPPPRRTYEREDIVFRRGEGERRPPPPRSEVDREEITIRRREEAHSPPARSERGTVEREELIIRDRERSLPPPRRRTLSRGPIAREREEFVFRRREPSPPPRELEHEEIIIRRRERTPPREPSPEPIREPSPEPPPPPPPVYRPPIVQEIITHHRHIDHGVERARSPEPPPQPPSPPPPPKDESLEIEIRRRGTRNGERYDEDIIIDRERSEKRPARERDMELTRTRSVSAPRTRRYDDDVAAEAEYYNRKVAERAYIGEAYNGATKDWAIVDVPPGTKRVNMEGIGGGNQEITWQRYNGVRRSKFYADEEVYGGDFGVGGGGVVEREEKRETRTKTKKDMWTEVTKDLVIKEAIEESGYDYEETEFFFYVIDYLRYEDVLQLVELSEEIRRERKERIREIQWEREELERIPAPSRKYDSVYEREVDYYRKSSGRYR